MNKLCIALAASFMAGVTVAEEAAAEEGEAQAKPAAEKKVALTSATFMTLPLCKTAEGIAEVRKPGGEWGAVEEGRFYPLGSVFRTGKRGKLVMLFGTGATATIEDGSSYATEASPLGTLSRKITLVSGTVDIELPDEFPEGAMIVAAHGFAAKNLAGKSRFAYEPKGDGDEATIRCVTGALSVEGRHFAIVAMNAADEVRLRSSHDDLVTILYGTSGDYTVRLDQGMRAKSVVDDEGNVKTSSAAETLDWTMSPKTRVQINRAVPALGERMSVTVMTFDAGGQLKNNFAFAEGRAEVNSGELVVAPKAEGEDLAKKRAAEATETTEAVDAEDNSSEKSENKENNSSSEE